MLYFQFAHDIPITQACYRPQTKFAKVMFLHVSVSHSVHRGLVSKHAVQVVSQHALQVSGGRYPGPHPGGSWGGFWKAIPACTEADPPPQTATAAGGTHPTDCILVCNWFAYTVHCMFTYLLYASRLQMTTSSNEFQSILISEEQI